MVHAPRGSQALPQEVSCGWEDNSGVGGRVSLDMKSIIIRCAKDTESHSIGMAEQLSISQQVFIASQN